MWYFNKEAKLERLKKRSVKLITQIHDLEDEIRHDQIDARMKEVDEKSRKEQLARERELTIVNSLHCWINKDK